MLAPKTKNSSISLVLKAPRFKVPSSWKIGMVSSLKKLCGSSTFLRPRLVAATFKLRPNRLSKGLEPNGVAMTKRLISKSRAARSSSVALELKGGNASICLLRLLKLRMTTLQLRYLSSLVRPKRALTINKSTLRMVKCRPLSTKSSWICSRRVSTSGSCST